MLDALCVGVLRIAEAATDDAFGNFATGFFWPTPASACARSSSGIDGLRKSPPTDARGLNGLPPIVLLPNLLSVILGVILIVFGDLLYLTETGAATVGLEGVMLDRRFTLLLAFNGVLGSFVVIGPFNVVSLVICDFGGWKVLVDARKSIGTASPLLPALELGRELIGWAGGSMDASCW